MNRRFFFLSLWLLSPAGEKEVLEPVIAVKEMSDGATSVQCVLRGLHYEETWAEDLEEADQIHCLKYMLWIQERRCVEESKNWEKCEWGLDLQQEQGTLLNMKVQ